MLLLWELFPGQDCPAVKVIYISLFSTNQPYYTTKIEMNSHISLLSKPFRFSMKQTTGQQQTGEAQEKETDSIAKINFVSRLS